MTPILLLHITAGGIGLLSGAAALIVRKGSGPHRLAGNAFVVSMLIMAASAMYLGVTGKFGIGASLSGALVFYLVTTGWLTARRKQRGIGVGEIIALLLGLIVLAAYVMLAMQTPPAWLAGPLVGVVIAGLGVGFDLWVILRGGISGTGRVIRHLWRMCLPLWQAASFFFLAQPDIFRGVPMLARAAPPLIVFALMVFWLVRAPFIARFKSLGSAPQIIPAN